MWNQNFVRSYSNECYLTDGGRNNTNNNNISTNSSSTSINSPFYMCDNESNFNQKQLVESENHSDYDQTQNYFGELNCKAQNDGNIFLDYNCCSSNTDLESNNNTSAMSANESFKLSNAFERFSTPNKISTSYGSVDTGLTTSSENSSSETIGYLNSTDSSVYLPKTNSNASYLTWNNEIYLMSENNCYLYNNSIIPSPMCQSSYLSNNLTKTSCSKKNVQSLLFGNYNCYSSSNERDDYEKDRDLNESKYSNNWSPSKQLNESYGSYKQKSRTKILTGFFFIFLLF